MGVYTRPAQLMAAQAKKYQQDAPKSIAGVTYDLAKLGRRDLWESVSGPLKEKVLRAMGHPYAKRARSQAQLASASRIAKGGVGLVQNRVRQVSRSGRVLPLPINVQTGELRRGIFVKRVRENTYDVGSSAAHAKRQFAPKGTKYMISRQAMGERMRHGFDGLLRKRHRARVQAYIVALRKTHRS